ncbi:putative outer membrane starch-binding protein [Marinilabilia salmonicolor]|jgi:hypothetical protein|uniref:RagB/SusD family nutrient uptake outer membrane protein n=1 Tax=Marinilabilia salmonicolor TaxID=989 RepID=UPI000D07A561|nr:RagB/SusD family nutrient uptake outer membrane protein [Marinilabilia salmonicolor]PRZ01637.1 putative outer membrane starch-binding protein [Marinilabilia salmonicolor]
MKKYISSILILLTLFTSCNDDFLEEVPKGQLTTNGFFQNEQDLELGLRAIYNKISTMFNATQIFTPLFGADDITTRTGSNKGPFREYDTFSATNSNPWVYYHYPYAVILASNNVIVNYPNAVKATEGQRQLAAGQAYFMRALSYFWLVRVFNEIPLITELEVNYEAVKASPEETFALIIEDLKKAEDFLPENWTGLKAGVAPTKGSAKALLASVYLQMAGYPVKDESKYALAAQKAKEVIDNKDVYGYRLLDNFADLWTPQQFNDEMVFSLVYEHQLGLGNMWAPLGGKPEEEGGWDDYMVEINFFNKFPEGPRKDATFQTIIRPDAETTLHWTEAAQKHPYYKKMQLMEGSDPEKPWINPSWWGSRTNMVIRYAEVLLIYAEAQAMASGPDASTYNALNQVRNRAGLEDMTTGLSKLAFRDSVVMERAWEFAGAEINPARWYDLVRLERVEEAASDRHEWELPIPNPPTKEDYFAPIPDSEIRINPNLK